MLPTYPFTYFLLNCIQINDLLWLIIYLGASLRMIATQSKYPILKNCITQI
jgi:hypothetical protein